MPKKYSRPRRLPEPFKKENSRSLHRIRELRKAGVSLPEACATVDRENHESALNELRQFGELVDEMASKSAAIWNAICEMRHKKGNEDPEAAALDAVLSDFRKLQSYVKSSPADPLSLAGAKAGFHAGYSYALAHAYGHLSSEGGRPGMGKKGIFERRIAALQKAERENPNLKDLELWSMIPGILIPNTKKVQQNTMAEFRKRK